MVVVVLVVEVVVVVVVVVAVAVYVVVVVAVMDQAGPGVARVPTRLAAHAPAAAPGEMFATDVQQPRMYQQSNQ